MRKLFSSTFREATHAQTSYQETSESRFSLGAVNRLHDTCLTLPLQAPRIRIFNVTLKCGIIKEARKWFLTVEK